MKLYGYDGKTGEFTGHLEAESDPLGSAIWAGLELGGSDAEVAQSLGLSEGAVAEVRALGREPTLAPAHSTEVPPPPSLPNRAKVFDGSAWSYLDDYRGVEVEANDGSRRKHRISELGIKPSEVQFDPLPEVQTRDEVRKLMARVVEYVLEPSEDKAKALMQDYVGLSDAVE